MLDARCRARCRAAVCARRGRGAAGSMVTPVQSPAPVVFTSGARRGPGSTNRPGPGRPVTALEDAAQGVPANSADLVQPSNGRAVTRVTEGLELLVPRDAEQQVDLVLELLDVTAGTQHGLAQALLRHDGVARGRRHGVVDAQPGRVGPA